MRLAVLNRLALKKNAVQSRFERRFYWIQQSGLCLCLVFKATFLDKSVVKQYLFLDKSVVKRQLFPDKSVVETHLFLDKCVIRFPIFFYSTKSQTTEPVTFIKSSGLILSCKPRCPALTKIWPNNWQVSWIYVG